VLCHLSSLQPLLLLANCLFIYLFLIRGLKVLFGLKALFLNRNPKQVINNIKASFDRTLLEGKKMEEERL
jgi:hypothetical protein